VEAGIRGQRLESAGRTSWIAHYLSQSTAGSVRVMAPLRWAGTEAEQARAVAFAGASESPPFSPVQPARARGSRIHAHGSYYREGLATPPKRPAGAEQQHDGASADLVAQKFQAWRKLIQGPKGPAAGDD